MVHALAQAVEAELSFGQYAAVILVAMLTSKGASASQAKA